MSTTFQKLPKTPNLTEMTYLRIKQSVLTGSIEPSFWLTEEHIATQLGVSKSPVREALNRLEGEGLISDRGAPRGVRAAVLPQRSYRSLQLAGCIGATFDF
ncbi:GntR family transcriptional regulator [Granulicella mallensis]|uniref:GntR family transcriptional regulator n=1 Tax=Granulicella mallensis TaxID=940614 RepID=UPI0028891D67|nr:GntR family transcriptional regulator [Granulicella mallensis]